MTAKRKRDYDKEYEWQGTPEQIARRSARNKARRLMEKKVGKAALKGKDVDHKKPLSQGGSNDLSNLQVTSVKYNRGTKNRGMKKGK